METNPSKGAEDVKLPPPQTVLTEPINEKVSRKHFWYWSLVIIAAIAAAAVVLASALKPEDTQLNISKQIHKNNFSLPKGYKFTPVKTGEYPTGFPEELRLFKDAKIIRGENIIDSTGVNHEIVDFLISQPLANVAALYQSKLPALKWELLGNPVVQGSLQILNFTKDKTILTIVISTKSAASSQVSLDVKESGQ
jgi:hypothetical protein